MKRRVDLKSVLVKDYTIKGKINLNFPHFLHIQFQFEKKKIPSFSKYSIEEKNICHTVICSTEHQSRQPEKFHNETVGGSAFCFPYNVGFSSHVYMYVLAGGSNLNTA